jgi:hypothetical protein
MQTQCQPKERSRSHTIFFAERMVAYFLDEHKVKAKKDPTLASKE